MVLILQDAFNPKEFLTVDQQTVFLVKVRIHNHVRNSCLILQTQKDEALRRSRTLPSDYASCYSRVLPVRHARQIARSFYFELGESLPAIRHRMRASAHARPVKIRNKTLFVRHLTQWRQFHLLRNRIQQRAGKPRRAFHLPQSSSSMHSPFKRVQRTNFAERYKLRFLQVRDTADQIINPFERAFLPLRDNLVGGGLPQPPDVTEPDAQTRNILVPFNRVLDGAVPFGSEALIGFTRRPCN